MNDNYASYMGWVVWDGWCEMSGVRWVVWSGAPQPFLEALSIDTATPNIVYTQQAAKPACQEDTNATFSHLLLAQLPRTQFTHSKLPNPHARKTSPFLEALSTAPATQTGDADQQDIHAKFSHLLLAQLPPSRRSEYCACHTDRSRGPAATRRAATLSRGSQYSSEYCACHADRSRGPAATRRAATLSGGSDTAPATQTGAADQTRRDPF